MTRKISVSILLCSMAVSAVIIIVTVSAVSDRKKAAAQNAADLPRITAAAQVLTQIGYYLKEYNGELAVFRGDSPTPYKMLGVGIELMSDEDKQLLKTGIFAESEEKLKMLIEDYTS